MLHRAKNCRLKREPNPTKNHALQHNEQNPDQPKSAQYPPRLEPPPHNPANYHCSKTAPGYGNPTETIPPRQPPHFPPTNPGPQPPATAAGAQFAENNRPAENQLKSPHRHSKQPPAASFASAFVTAARPPSELLAAKKRP